MILAQGSAIGRYQVRRKLAEGGMAEIYLASALGPEGFAKEVVIKVVRPFLTADRQFIDMFIAEARLASKLNHANIVQIFDFGKHEDSYYLAMEYVRGASLWDLRRRCRERSVPMHPTLVAEIGAQVARGLQYAHTLNDRGQPLAIVHRDVTPHNVLLAFDGAVKLTDFGIAKASSTHTAPGMLKGKFAYMSPEQAAGDAVDLRTDVFALGIVLWEMATGGRLFEADTDVAVLKAVREAVIAPPHRVNPDVPSELSAIIMKALARPLSERFASAFELDRALAQFVLRSSQSVEDQSVAFFLQQMFREEFEEANQMGTPAAGQVAVKRPPEYDSTAQSGLLLGETLNVDRSAENLAQSPHASQTVTAQGRVKQTVPIAGVVPRGFGEERSTAPLELQDPVKGSTEEMPGKPDPTKVVPKPIARPLSLKLPPVVVREEIAPPDSELESSVDDSLPISRETASLTSPAEEVVKAPTTPTSRGFIVGGLAVAALLIGFVGYRIVKSDSPSDAEVPPAVTALTPIEVMPKALPSVAVATVKPLEMVEPDSGTAGAALALIELPVREKAEAPVPVLAPVVAVPSESVKAEKHSGTRSATVPAVAMGSIQVKAVPFATTYLDGRVVGEVEGLRSFTVKPGTYEVMLVHPKKKQVLYVKVEANKAAKVEFDARAP